MSRYKDNAEEFRKFVDEAKNSNKPVITAQQKKREPGELHFFQKEIIDSLNKMKSCDLVFSVSKKRLKKGESCLLKIDYNGKRLIPLKNK